MRFQLDGQSFDIDPAVARARILSSVADPVATHWVEIDRRRWPAKQALEVVTGVSRSAYVSHRAVQLLARLGFETSTIPRSETPSTAPPDRPETPRRARPISTDEAAEAFAVLDAFLQNHPLTTAIAQLEKALDSADLATAAEVASGSSFDLEVVSAALLVRQRIGVIDSVIHAAVITQTIPMILDEGEYLVKRPSLGAGNDAQRVFDLETNLRVAEFKVAQWKGADSLRQRGLVADLAGLALDDTGRRRQLFVVGDLPKHFLETSGRTVVSLLSKAAQRLRQPGALALDLTVAQFTEQCGVEIIDLAQWFPSLARSGAAALS